MNIGELARAADTKVETIRYYERIGLLPPPPRTAGNYRDYSSAHVSRLTFTRRARDLGFSVEQIRALIDLADNKEQSCEAVDLIAREHLANVSESWLRCRQTCGGLLCGDPCRQEKGHGHARPRHAQAVEGPRCRMRHHDRGASSRGGHGSFRKHGNASIA
jgi:DNA-binding transcriptional MerR regulator